MKSVNGVTVDPLKLLEKSNLKHRDRIRVDYEGKIFSGVIDLETESPPLVLERKMPSSPNSPLACGQLEAEEHPGSPCLGALPKSVNPSPCHGWSRSWSYLVQKSPGKKLLQKRQVSEHLRMYTVFVYVCLLLCTTVLWHCSHCQNSLLYRAYIGIRDSWREYCSCHYFRTKSTATWN